MDKNIEKHITDYLLNGDSGEPMSPELREWLAEDASNEDIFRQYKKIWAESSNYQPPIDFNTQNAWHKIDSVNRKRKLRLRRLKNIGYAASGIAATALIFIFMLSIEYYVRPTIVTEVSTNTAYGSRSEILLPDGTNVKLNAGTTIKYIYNRKSNTREVDFRGEAFFEVAKSDAPFIIHNPDNLNIEVLGTTFSLSAYEEDEIFSVSLLEGSIELSLSGINNRRSGYNSKLKLSPGEMVQYDRNTKKLQKLDKDISHSYGWMNNKLYMDNMSLADVCKKLERWYDVKIQLEPGLENSAHYTGVLQEDNITDILNALCSLSKIKYEINGRQISITRK